MATFSDKAAGVGAFVVGKVQPLQRRFLATGPGTSDARATIAKLRRLGTSAGSGWMLVGDQVLDGWPEDLLGQPVRGDRPTRELLAVQAALRFYGLHQQSQHSGMAMDGRTSAPGAYRGGFGQACRRIEPKLDGAANVQRKLLAIEGAADFDGVLYQIRALISLLKAKAIPLDYFAFASDLYRLQFDAAREGVLARWADEYYLYRVDVGEEPTE